MRVIVIFVIILSVFICEANAQLCGSYTTTLFIKNEAGEPIKNASVKIVALQKKDRTKGHRFVRDAVDASKLSITFSEGYQVEGKYKIIVSADGYSVIEKEIEFPHCERQKIDFTLAKNSFGDLIILSGTTYDYDSKTIRAVSIKVIGENGQIFSTVSDDKGHYRIAVPLGKYEVEFQKDKFVKAIFQNVIIKKSDNGKMNLDAHLEKSRVSQ